MSLRSVPDILCLMRERCAICLELQCSRPTLLERCGHVFCFQCIAAWARVSPCCPLCKAAFDEGVCDARSEFDYERVALVGDSAGSMREGSIRALLGRFPHRRIVYLDSLAPSAAAMATHRLRPRVSAVKLKRGCPVPERVASWLAREVEAAVLVPSEFVVSIVLLVLEKFGSASADAVSALDGFMAPHTARFLRELEYFVASGLGMTAFDAGVAYMCECCGSDMVGACAPLKELASCGRLATRLDVDTLLLPPVSAGGSLVAPGEEIAKQATDTSGVTLELVVRSALSSPHVKSCSYEATCVGDSVVAERCPQKLDLGTANAIPSDSASAGSALNFDGALKDVRLAAAREFALVRMIAAVDAEIAVAKEATRRAKKVRLT